MNDILEIKSLIKDADAILISAGAGMGVDSGLPDFRGNEGFWKAYPPIEELGYGFAEMASSKWFETKPSFAWAFYGHRLNLYRETIPHDGFRMLLDLVQKKNNNYFIFTSNVDGQFQKAGFDKSKICEIHGSIHHLQCSKDRDGEIWHNEENINVDIKKFKSHDIPLCPKCQKTARPNILMFSDWFWNSKRTDNQIHKYRIWLQENKDKNIVVIELGAGVEISTVRETSEKIARNNKNAVLIRINPRDYKLDSDLGYSISFGALEGLTQIMQ